MTGSPPQPGLDQVPSSRILIRSLPLAVLTPVCSRSLILTHSRRSIDQGRVMLAVVQVSPGASPVCPRSTERPDSASSDVQPILSGSLAQWLLINRQMCPDLVGDGDPE